MVTRFYCAHPYAEDRTSVIAYLSYVVVFELELCLRGKEAAAVSTTSLSMELLAWILVSVIATEKQYFQDVFRFV